MMQKLKTILEVRKTDLLVRGLVLGQQEYDDDEDLGVDICF